MKVVVGMKKKKEAYRREEGAYVAIDGMCVVSVVDVAWETETQT